MAEFNFPYSVHSAPTKNPRAVAVIHPASFSRSRSWPRRLPTGAERCPFCKVPEQDPQWCNPHTAATIINLSLRASPPAHLAREQGWQCSSKVPLRGRAEACPAQAWAAKSLTLAWEPGLVVAPENLSALSTGFLFFLHGDPAVFAQ